MRTPSYMKQASKLRRKAVLLPAIGALAITPVLVHTGDTLSGIAASHNVSLAAVERANPQIPNPDLIFTGQTVNVPGGSGGSQSAPGVHHHSVGVSVTPRHHHHSAGLSGSSGGSSSGSSSALNSSDLANVPGVPHAFAACVAFRESTNGTNQAFNGGVYGIIRASGINVNGQSLAAQKAAFSKLFAQFGTRPWAPSDGCS